MNDYKFRTRVHCINGRPRSPLSHCIIFSEPRVLTISAKNGTSLLYMIIIIRHIQTKLNDSKVVWEIKIVSVQGGRKRKLKQNKKGN
jgi:hypothetical protein